MKKILTAFLIGAFVFGVSVADMNFASAQSSEKKIETQAKNSAEKNSDGKDMKKPPEPPKDSNGNPIPPPDKKSKHVKNGDQTSTDSNAKHSQHRNKNSADEKNPPEPPKDSNGNPLPPPDKNHGEDNGNHQQTK